MCQDLVKPTDKIVRHQVYELPVIKLPVTEYKLAIGKCRCCGEKQVAQLPRGVSFGITGPRLTSFMSIIVARYQLSRRQLQEFLKEQWNFNLSLGSIFNKQRLVNDILKEPIEALLPVIKKEDLHLDETRHRQSGNNHWLWVMASKHAALFKITRSRGKKVLRERMDDFENRVTTDRYVVYNYFDAHKRQLCWAHLKRDFTRVWQIKPSRVWVRAYWL